MNAPLAALVSFALLAGVFWPLERLFPARKGQRWLHRAKSVDTLFFLGQYLVWSGVAVSALALVQPYIAGLTPLGVRTGFRALPVPVQLVAALSLADLGCYWFHRACHRFDLLWRFHAVHHSAPEVDWLAAHREHPLDGIFTQLAINLPVMLLGLPLEWLAGLVAFRGLWAIFVHSNVKLPLGPLLYLFGSPQLHRWHHARDGMARHNFANLAPYMDLLFGTFHRPKEEEQWEVGLGAPFPSGYVGQLVHPFVPEGVRSRAPMRALFLMVVGFVVVSFSCGGPMGQPDGGTGGGAGGGGAGGPRISLPDCGTNVDGGTGEELYELLATNYGCAAGGCHGLGGFHYLLTIDAGSLRSEWVNKPSVELPTMNRVTPGNVDKSYVLYKLVDQQVDAGGGSGERMPYGGPYLTDPDLCRVVNWVKSGAR